MESYQQQIYEADPTNSPTYIKAARIDVRGRNTMVVEQGCLATCDGQAARTHAATSRKKGTIRIARC